MSQAGFGRARPDKVSLSDIGGGIRKAAGRNPATQRLFEAAQGFAAAKAEKVLGKVGDKVSGATKNLTGIAEGDDDGGGMVGEMVKETLSGSSPGKAAAKAGVQGLKEKVKGIFGRGKGKSSGGKYMNIVEDLYVPVPARMAYNHWTQYQDFPKWSKGVQSVDFDKEDETKSSWKAKIAWSNRNWKATTSDQIPDDRIVWRSEGQTVVNGAVSFHQLEDNLTQVLLLLEYHPHGFFEKTANLWRAQGRRARLDFKLFRHYVTVEADPEEEGWRGEIRDGELVRDHDEVMREEEEERERERGDEEEEERERERGDEEDEDRGEEDRGEEEDEDRDEEDESEEEDEDRDEEDEGERPPRQRQRPRERQRERSGRR
ncbi:SRPBCC family protein [Actinopolymorpha singaporensis]|uniref:Polyketide cyclase / dehydrase and lipid transport n=1 Tax=Actinopolymorpha singaporensis TaxID=117157 RepID=A0A1H1TGT5_9ACTN|nr:SRPBCC family protein [Actinopolymorpha singaporensis]SDS59408.1 Polyketide cyclase / dehydrase and lipid transport [Actinopolymorpha singaporensis]